MSGKFWDKGPQLVAGCTRVSAGCDKCWAERAHRMRSKGPNPHIWPPECLTDGRFNGHVRFNLDALRNAVKGKKPQVIAPWNDLYHEDVTDEQIFKTIAFMMGHKQHTFLIITKRPERAAVFMPEFMDLCFDFAIKKAPEAHPMHILSEKTPLFKKKFFRDALNENSMGHIWHIATMENQAMVDERMPHLLNIPGKRGIIIEPMLGPVCFHRKAWINNNYACLHCEKPWWSVEGAETPLKSIHQVILGGETGPGARPMHPDWVRSVRDQCKAAGVPFYFKSWGEWKHVIHQTGASYVVEANEPDMYIHYPMRDMDKEKYSRYETMGNDAFIKTGPKKAGRILDGIEHNALAWRTS